MKDLFKSKVMISFAVFVIGILIVTSVTEKSAQKNDLHALKQTSQLKICVI